MNNFLKFGFYPLLNARFEEAPAGQSPAATPQGGGGQIAPSAEPPSSPEPQAFDFTKAISPDGKLLDGWKKGIPEEYRDELSLNTFDSFPEAMRQLISAQKMIGKDKIVIPNEKSTKAEWDSFYERLGRPKEAGQYKYTPDQELSIVDMSPEFMNPILAEFHKAGYNQKQLDVALGQFQGFLKNLEQTIEREDDLEYEEASKKITDIAAREGFTVEDDAHEANLLIAENSPNEEFKEALLEAINDNTLRPYLHHFLASVHRKYFAAHEGMPAGEGTPSVMTPGSMRNQAQELQATPGYMDGTMKNTNPAQYKRLTDQITALFNKADAIEKGKK